MIEEIFPFTAEFSHNLVTIIDSEDIKGTKFWSDENLFERYYKSQGKTYTRKMTPAEEKEELRKIQLAVAEQAKKEARLKAEENEAAAAKASKLK